MSSKLTVVALKNNIIAHWPYIAGGWTKWHTIIFNVINMFALMYAFMQLNADTFLGKSKRKHSERKVSRNINGAQ